MYSNSKILAAVIANWAKPLIDQVLLSRIGDLQQVSAASEWVKKYFPVSGNYSIVNDLAFLAVPAVGLIVEPLVTNGLAKLGVPEEQIPSYAAKMADAMLAEAEKNGKVTLFNAIELEKSDFKRLKKLIDKNLPVTEEEAYTVIE